MQRKVLQLFSKACRIQSTYSNPQNVALLSCRHNYTYTNDIQPDITAVIQQYGDKVLSARVDEILRYNQPPKDSPMAYFLDASEAFHELAEKRDITEENVRLAKILSWCLKTTELSYIILDDLMDSDITRYGKPCWYLLEGVNTAVINDSLLIEQICFYVLKQAFGPRSDVYPALFDLFVEMKFVTALGQVLDTRSGTVGVENFDFKFFNAIAANKTAFCSVYVPIACGMHHAGIKDEKLYQRLKTVTGGMGQLFQSQNDYSGCYEDPKQTGKISNDIQEGKCTWLATKCVQKSSKAQLELLKECYGSKDERKVLQVKQLYDELRLPEEFENHRLALVSSVRNSIQQLEHRKLGHYMTNLLDSLYKENRLFVHDHASSDEAAMVAAI